MDGVGNVSVSLVMERAVVIHDPQKIAAEKIQEIIGTHAHLSSDPASLSADADLYARDERIDAAGRSRLRDARLRAATAPILHEEFFVIEALGDNAVLDGGYEEYDNGRAAGTAIASRPRMQ